METQQLLQADYLDIVFDQRNKKYGGYDLRKNYPNRAKRAVSGVLIVTFIVASIPVIAGMNEKSNGKIVNTSCPTVLNDVPVYHPPKAIVQPPHSSGGTAGKTIASTVPVIKPTHDVIDVPKPLDTAGAVPGPTTNLNGKIGGDITSTSTTGSTGNGKENKPGIDVPVISEPVHYADQMPEFNGNMGTYLQNHLSYPEDAREQGKEGRVIISFVVGEDGSIVNAEIGKGIYKSLDQEALRVVKSMPHWKPGRVQGKPVKVYFSIPINFVLN